MFRPSFPFHNSNMDALSPRSGKSPRRKRRALPQSKSRCASPTQLPVELWSMISDLLNSFTDKLSLVSACKYLAEELDPWQQKTVEFVASLSKRRSKRVSVALTDDNVVENDNCFIGLNSGPLECLESWRDEYWLLYACKSPKDHIHRFGGYDSSVAIQSRTTVAAFVDWLLDPERQMNDEDNALVGKIFSLAPTLIGSTDFAAAIAQKLLFERRFGTCASSKGLFRTATRLAAVLKANMMFWKIFDPEFTKRVGIICDTLFSKSRRSAPVATEIREMFVEVKSLPAPLIVPQITPSLSQDYAYSTILRWKPKEIARALTVIEAQLALTILPHELYGGRWTKRRHDPAVCGNVKAMITHFNVMSSWVASSILSCSDLSKRAERLSMFLKTCKHLQALNNFNSAMEIFAGCSSGAICRLKVTHSQLSSKVIALEEDLGNSLSADSNFAHIRSALWRCQHNKIPSIPYLGLVLGDALCVVESEFPPLDNRVGESFSVRRVNSIYEFVIDQLLATQRELPELIATMKAKVDPILLNYLQFLPGKSENDLFGASLVLEPRMTSVSLSKLNVNSPIPDPYPHDI